LRINGYKKVAQILTELSPYIRFKKIQAKALVTACNILSSKKFSELTKKQLNTLVDLILIIQNENYVTKKKKDRKQILIQLGLTP
jgi:CRISPR/Cas system CSM-associated protein Csm2 small subunit